MEVEDDDGDLVEARDAYGGGGDSFTKKLS